MLIAPQNYARDQKYMLLNTNIGHPGWVIKNKRKLILTNTDKHKSFVRILKLSGWFSYLRTNNF